MDGRSAKTTEVGGILCFDAVKRVKGRKCHILVDILSPPIESRVPMFRIESEQATQLPDALVLVPLLPSLVCLVNIRPFRARGLKRTHRRINPSGEDRTISRQ